MSPWERQCSGVPHYLRIPSVLWLLKKWQGHPGVTSDRRVHGQYLCYESLFLSHGQIFRVCYPGGNLVVTMMLEVPQWRRLFESQP